jgi:hypothetical protein
MFKGLFFHKLAVERCQHNLAQLCAVIANFQGQTEESAEYYNGTALLLIETMNRDLTLLHDIIDGADIESEERQRICA